MTSWTTTSPTTRSARWASGPGSGGLYAYPATPGKTTTVAPDLATALPTVTNGGKTYTVTIRTGAMWDTSPPRQVTAADALLGLKRSCNPTQPFGGLPDFEALIVGYQAFCDGFAKVSSTSVSAIKKYIETHQISGVKASGADDHVQPGRTRRATSRTCCSWTRSPRRRWRA